MDEMAPDFVVIDSIQTIYLQEVTSAPGSVTQVRECTSELMRMAKTKGISYFYSRSCYKRGSDCRSSFIRTYGRCCFIF